MVETIKNFTVGALDSSGRQIVGDNHVSQVLYYSSVAETWRRDFTNPPSNPIINPNFTAVTVTGTAPGAAGPGWYELGIDATASPETRFFKIGALPLFYWEDVLAEHGTLIEYTPAAQSSALSVVGDYFINAGAFTTPPKNVFPLNYSVGYDTNSVYATSSGITMSGTGEAFIAWELDSIQDIVGFYIDDISGEGVSDANVPRCAIQDYTIQVAVSGNGKTTSGTIGVGDGEYSTVVSGSFPFGDIRTKWVPISSTPAKFVRVIYSNHGGTRTHLQKFWAYSQDTVDKGMSLKVTRVSDPNTVGVGGRTIDINQDINFAGVASLYFDIHDYDRSASDFASISFNGSSLGDVFVNHQPLSSTGSYTIRNGYYINTSSLGAGTLRIRKKMGKASSQSSGFLSIGNFTTVPPWHAETPSNKRGDGASFPQEVLFVVDRKGLSIIDVSASTAITDIDPILWMRFDLGERKMLQQRPRKMASKNGRLYMATSAGLYMFDFICNCAVRLDHRGVWKRYGIHLRNINAFDGDEFTTSSTMAERMVEEYCKVSSNSVPPSRDIYDVVVGNDGVFGDFVVLGTSAGLLVFDDKYDGTGVFYQSKDHRPVRNVKLAGETIWYTQGDASSTTINFVDSINSITTSNFIPTKIYQQGQAINDSLTGLIDRDSWLVVNQDPAMQIIEGSVLTISGSHTEGGATGIISKAMYSERSFTATLKVCIKEFPPDARGGVRFGFCYDVLDQGVRSLSSSEGFSNRNGFFISALNINPYTGPIIQDSKFNGHQWSEYQNWFVHDSQRNKSSTKTLRGIGLGGEEGIQFITSEASASSAAGEDAQLVRAIPVWPMRHRDFTVRLDVKAASQWVPKSSTTSDNPAIWLGVSSKDDFIPGTINSSNYISNCMVFAGKTTFSGVSVYTTAKFDGTALLASPTFTQGQVVAAFASDNQGQESTPFREWRIDYNHSKNELSSYIDGQFINSFIDSQHPQPPDIGIAFGTYYRSPSLSPGEFWQAFFKNFRITYPALNPTSRFKYGLELTTEQQDNGQIVVGGGINNNITHFTTYSGIQLNPDSTPAIGVLNSLNSLSDGVLHSSGTPFGQFISLGVALSGTKTVEALYVYDTVPSTDGWDATNSKLVEFWSSSDNSVWNLEREYDLNTQERLKGVTKINFCPAIDAKFIKMRGLDITTNYNVGGGTPYSVSEIRAMTLSGIDFMPGDGTPSSIFREWKLTYDAPSRQITGYVDGVLASTASFPEGIEEGQFAILHDLTPVNSGTTSVFHAEFKELEIVFDDPSYVSSGNIDALAVNVNEIPGGGTNYTLMTASNSNVAVADFELGAGSTLPDTVRFFDHGTDIFGASTLTHTIFGDAVAHRDEGLVFVGTSNFTSTPKYIQRYAKPWWFERTLDPIGTLTTQYGGQLSIGYHPGENRIIELISKNANYAASLDLDMGVWEQISRNKWREVSGATSSDNDLQRDAAKVTYSHYNNRMVYLFSNNRLLFMDVLNGDVVRALIPGTTNIAGNSGHYGLAYVLHNHTILYSQDKLAVWDVANNKVKDHPRNWATSPEQYNRFQTLLPFHDGTGFVGGHTVAEYCDHDKCIYWLGTINGDLGSQQYFYRYYPDKDWFELLSAGSPKDLRYPYMDEETIGRTPVFAGYAKRSWLVYEPIQKRMYVVASRGAAAPLLYYYDVVTNEWVYPGESPPYIGQRGWPDAEPATFSIDAGHALYNIKDRTIVMYGRPDDAAFYEYHPEKDNLERSFEYIPSRDGIPTTSGLSFHFTRGNQTFQKNYNDSSEWERDFYKVRADTTSTYTPLFSGGQPITWSGTSISISGPQHDFWMSSELMDARRSFDITANVAIPKFDKVAHRGPGDGALDITEVTFSLGIQDGLNPIWSNSTWGQEDSNLFQSIELRVGVSGTLAGITENPFVGYIQYEDGQNNEVSSTTFDRHRSVTYDTYKSGGIPYTVHSEFKEFRLSYDYDTDVFEGFIEGTSVGATTLRRKFNPEGVRFRIGMASHVGEQSTYPSVSVVQVKDIVATPKAWDRVDHGRLVTSISGSVGNYYHEKWDMTLISGSSWVYETDIYFPTYKKFTGFDYIGSLAAVGDGHKLAELVAFIGPGQKKQIAFTSDPSLRYDRSTYLATIDHEWGDLELGKYRLVHDIDTQLVSVFVNDSLSPSISVDYNTLPNYKFKHIYYGKVDYGDFEEVFAPATLSGTWVSQPDFTGGADPSVRKQRWLNNSAYAAFATINQQSPLAFAEYSLGNSLGEVDVYTWYVASGLDLAKDTPHTITASGIINLPNSGGEGSTIVSTTSNTDAFGNFDSFSTTIRVDQRRVIGNRATTTNKNELEGSGWIYLGRYTNPTKVVVTVDVNQNIASSQAFVCAGAIGVDVGVRGKSTFDMSVKYVRYQTGQTEINDVVAESAGISIIDLSTNEQIDNYGVETAPALLDGNITSGNPLE